MDSSQEIINRYAKEAETYRRDAWLVNFDSEKLFEEFKKIIRKLFNREDKIKILDIGAGNGMLTEVVLQEFPNAEITMLDFSQEMLESSKAIFKIKNISLDRINFVKSDFITDDFPSDKYELIISSYALHHIRNVNDLRIVYSKINRSLNKSGTFICLDYYLEKSDDLRKKQAMNAFNKWIENFNSEEVAKEWANIINGEDTPATLSLIISSINDCNNVIPFLSSNKGVLAAIYGMTKLDIERLNELGLTKYIEEAKKDLGQEKLIDAYPFE